MLRARVESFIARHCLVHAGETVVVAVSGGADSLCLLLALHELARDLNIHLHIAHLNHLLRPDAADDAEFVAKVARRLELPATVAARDVQATRATTGLSLEAAARRTRYTFLREVAEQTGAARVAVGHTADDQAETVLLHVIRGTGLAGLRGMAPETRLRLPGFAQPLTVIRPLLEVERRETEQCCRERGYEPRQDPTNRLLNFQRNRIRWDLIPRLEASYNPAIRRALIRTARAAADDFDYISAEVDRVWLDLVQERPGSIELKIAGVCALSRSLERHLLRRAFACLVDGEEELGAEHVERLIVGLERHQTGTRLELPGVVVTLSYETATLERAGRKGEQPGPLPLPELVEGRLAVPGLTTLGAWRVDAELREAGAAGEPGRWTGLFDVDRTGRDLQLRRRRPGDRFQPLGLGGFKRVQDFLVDAKVPRAWRDRVPIVVSPDGIIWVAGWRIDERYKVTPATRTILRLEFARDDVAD